MDLAVCNEKAGILETSYKGQIWGIGKGWCFKEVSDRYEVRLWKAIRKLWAIVSSSLFFYGQW